ncbi:DUF4190 domain-containing protein [Dactylosporangium sp. NPDC049525]|uniref:DUF4190 domain-containing protein n=1 Tax=Dactylosporangium sp. NPDC049525 TaxID=3154730 RepID=UPI0034261D45
MSYPYQHQPVPQHAPPPPGMRIDLVQGTPFGVAYPLVQPTPSGPAIGSLVAGIVSIFVGLTVSCLGAAGAAEGWGPVAGGAFTVLSVFLGLGAIGLGVFAMRQVRRAGRLVSGRGMAITGLVLGSVGAAIGVLSLLAAFLIAAAA